MSSYIFTKSNSFLIINTGLIQVTNKTKRAGKTGSLKWNNKKYYSFTSLVTALPALFCSIMKYTPFARLEASICNEPAFA